MKKIIRAIFQLFTLTHRKSKAIIYSRFSDESQIKPKLMEQIKGLEELLS